MKQREPKRAVGGTLARRRRDVAVEALRLFAICGIAVFHTFQPFFDSYAYGLHAVSVSWVNGGCAFALGLVSLLGAAGNSVFFMISGYYLLPRMRERATRPGFWRGEGRAFRRRAGVILLSVALYLLVGLLAQSLGARLFTPSHTIRGWLSGGLEFIWLYLAFLALAPLVARLSARAPRFCRVLFALVSAAVVLLDLWIAFFDRGSFSRGLFDWRKLMSGATYLVAFLSAGVLGRHPLRAARLGVPALTATLTLIVFCEALAAFQAGRGSVFLLGALSYKSTSVLSLLLAACLLAFSTGVALRHPAERTDEREPSGASVVRTLASSILGFYISQSLLFEPWSLLCTRGLARLPFSLGPALFFVAALGASLLYALALMAADLLLRAPLVSFLRRGGRGPRHALVSSGR